MAAGPLDLAGEAARRLAFSLLPRALNGVVDAANYFSDATLRIGVTGLSRAGKTAFLTSAAAALLARAQPRITLAPLGAGDIPRFDHAAHIAALAADPPQWPARTGAVAILALDVTLPRPSPLPPRKLRLEFLDYPGEWLLDLPLLTQSYAAWSQETLKRLQAPAMAGHGQQFLAFTLGLAAAAPADESLAASGTALYRDALRRAQQAGLSFLQPGRHLMPAPGAEPPWTGFFPYLGSGGLQELMAQRYRAYCDAVRRDLASPMFAEVDRLVVLADILSALHGGAEAFADAQAALAAASAGLRYRFDWLDAFSALAQLRRPPRVIARVAFAATKADHVGERQRGNLRQLMRALAPAPEAGLTVGHFAIASVRCTEDLVKTLQGHAVSAVRGMIAGERMMHVSYPGEVPDLPPDARFFAHPFLSLPEFIPQRLPQGGRLGVPNIDLDKLLEFILPELGASA